MIVTFYSYKGGVGRSMALANVADLLARSGMRVLIVDFDLEAPGLEHFFPIDHAEVRGHEGLLDLLLTFKQSMSTASSGQDERDAFKELDRFISTVYPFREDAGGIDLLPAGRRLTDTQASRYAEDLRRFDWVDFYYSWSGELFFEWLRRSFTDRYDVVLVDSRTGVTEMGGICAYQLADVILLMCAPNLQNVEGTEAMARHFLSIQVRAVRHDRPVEVLIVPARVDQVDTSLRRKFERRFEQRFASFAPAALVERELSLWNLQIPYEPKYAFDEQVITDPSRREERRGLAAAYGTLISAIALLAPDGTRFAALRPAATTGDGEPRGPVETRYDPTTRFAAAEVFLSFGRGVELAAAQIQQMLLSAGLSVAMSADPGSPDAGVPRDLSDAIAAARVGLILIGSEGDRSPQRQREIEQLMSPGADRQVLAVTLPGVTREQVPAALLSIPTLGFTAAGAASSGVLVSAVRSAITQRGPAPLVFPDSWNPYPGPVPFREEYAGVLFGRHDEVNALLEKLRLVGMCSVVGPAGIGKTSVVSAGLVPALRRGAISGSERWPVVSIRTGTRPLATLIEAMARMQPQGHESPSDIPTQGLEAIVRSLRESFDRVVLVVDHMEELLTQAEPAERDEFVASLITLRRGDPPLIMPIFVLRSEVLMQMINITVLHNLVLPNSIVIQPLDASGLRSAIERPARTLGVLFEPGLVDLLVGEVRGEPGGLAPMQMVLRKLWDSQRDGYLTHSSYTQIGGVSTVLVKTAEAKFDAMTFGEQRIARGVLLQMVEIRSTGFGRGNPVGVEELVVHLADQELSPSEVRRVVDMLVEIWLLTVTMSTFGGPQVHLTYEGIIQAWFTFRQWIEEDRRAVQVRTELTALARGWSEADQDPSLLLTAARLTKMSVSLGDITVTGLEREYVTASRRHARASRRANIVRIAAWTLFALAVSGVLGLNLPVALLVFLIALILWTVTKAIATKVRRRRTTTKND